ncbi:Shedu anti-phage system protein SduA domain-containing protein [Rhizobium phaseoli]|uniref:Shedu anti-phage system protein SduA domain-containing protein n=1 Tax=Rhizobium phaseoli TaxID=396 RepID=UPI0007EC00A2|nr:Shedu anti-phage system protein SduA domain-containing protein [Rhizobium phaseoli]
MPISAEEYAEFERLADDESHRERECTRFLEEATDLLLPSTPVATIHIALEQRSPYGRSDYIVVADIRSDTGQQERHMVFWELKAPQCHLVEIDDSNTRYRPTKDLVKAETQLLHYVHQAAGDRDLLERYDIRYTANVIAGGIIIGRDNRLVRPGAGVDPAAAQHSYRIRQTHIYNKVQIRVMTWDRIMNLVKPE